MPHVSVVVPIFNSLPHLGTFFDALAEALPADSQVVVVDDASTQPVLDAVPELPRAQSVVRLRNERNLGVAGATNRGFAEATGDVVIQLNTDVVVDRDCLSAMVDLIESRPGDVGIVGSKLVYPTTGLTQSVGMAFGLHSKRHLFRHLPQDHPLCRPTRELQIVGGATVAMTARVLQAIGPLDEDMYNHNPDIDHCLRAVQRGFRNFMCAPSVAYHWRNLCGTAVRYARVEAAEAAFWSKWGGSYRTDLGDFIDEGLEHASAAHPAFAASPFTILDLSRAADQAIALDRIAARWPGAERRIRHVRQMSNAEPRLWLPLLLPHWLVDAPTPYLYLVDDHQELTENAMWFERRRRVVEEELIVDLAGAALATSELQSAAGLAPAQYST